MAGRDQFRYQVSKTDLTGHDQVLARVAVEALSNIGIAMQLDVNPLPPFVPNTPSTLSEMVVRGRRQRDIAVFLDLFALGREETIRRLRDEAPQMASGESMLPYITGMRRGMAEREAAVSQMVFERAHAIAAEEVKVKTLAQRARRAHEQTGSINTWHLRRCR